MTEQDIEEGKGLAIISYLTIIGTIIAFFMNNEKKNAFAAFHTRQALGLWLTYFIVAWAVSGFDNWFATLGFWLFFGILFIYGFINAVAGRPQEVPVLGSLFQKWFASIGR